MTALLPPRQDPEVQLMARVRRGDDRAFNRLVELYYPRIFGRLFRVLRDRQEAEDMTQDVFLRLYRSRHTYKAKAKFSTWIFLIANNVLRNALRSRRRHAFLRYGSTETAEARESPRAPEVPERPLERAELAGVVRDAVRELAGPQRQALEMLQFQDRSYAEIAQTLHLTLKATKSLLYRARLQLREMLTPRVELL